MKTTNTINATQKVFYVKSHHDYFAAKHPTHEPWVGKRMTLPAALELGHAASASEEGELPLSDDHSISGLIARAPPCL